MAAPINLKELVRMDDIALARAIHVVCIVIWIGGVAMVTTVILPMVRRFDIPERRLALLAAVAHRFVWQARIATLLVAASGFYMTERLHLWGRFRSAQFWWMHAMVLVWLIFTVILFIAEPLVMRGRSRPAPAIAAEVKLSRMQWLHWVLLILSLITVLAAVAGSQGMSVLP
jgi:uncharacterized membrane protein